jgi:hypothetical protein
VNSGGRVGDVEQRPEEEVVEEVWGWDGREGLWVCLEFGRRWMGWGSKKDEVVEPACFLGWAVRM